MEIIPIFTQSAPDVATLMAWVMAACGLATAIRCLQMMWIRRRLPSLNLPATFSLSALPLLISQGVVGSAPSTRSDHNPVTEIQTSPALGERIPLLSPPARAGETSSRAHPAIHGVRTDGPLERLFPAASLNIPKVMEPWERGAIDLRRRATRRGVDAESTRTPRLHARGHTSHHVVVTGDTLWDIAATVLGTTDQRAIARYWPRIHKENVDVIGKDPNLLRPGQVLSLPPRIEE